MNGCEIVANNKTDFVIADSIENGEIPCLIKGRSIFVSEMLFDIDTCCKNNNLFCVRLKKVLNDLNKEESVEGKFNLIQAFLEQQMPICEKSKLGERTGKFFDGAVFSDLVENKMSMCTERSAMAQYLCQMSGIKSYFVNSLVCVKKDKNNPPHIEKEPHTYIIFENNGQMYVYDPANPTKGDKARIMNTDMDKTIFSDFVKVVNENADSDDITKKKRAGFECLHEDGKIFLYCSYCGRREASVTPRKLKGMRAAKLCGGNVMTR